MPALARRKPLNVVTAWIGMKSSEREKPSVPRASASVRTLGVTFGLTCEGVQARAFSERATGIARGKPTSNKN